MEYQDYTYASKVLNETILRGFPRRSLMRSFLGQNCTQWAELYNYYDDSQPLPGCQQGFDNNLYLGLRGFCHNDDIITREIRSRDEQGNISAADSPSLKNRGKYVLKLKTQKSQRAIFSTPYLSSSLWVTHSQMFSSSLNTACSNAKKII